MYLDWLSIKGVHVLSLSLSLALALSLPLLTGSLISVTHSCVCVRVSVAVHELARICDYACAGVVVVDLRHIFSKNVADYTHVPGSMRVDMSAEVHKYIAI